MRRYPSEVLTGIPAFLKAAEPPPTASELEEAAACRREFLFRKAPEPYMHDIIRAFRLLRGMRNYMEIGTYDKGNLAYVSGLLAPAAKIVDIDIEEQPARTEKVIKRLQLGQQLFTVVEDSALDATVDKVASILKDEPVDAVFIDGNHTAEYVVSDYALYSPFVRSGGLILFHDVYWPGDEKCLGVAIGLAQIDRFSPVYVVRGATDRIHRFFPSMTKEVEWGSVAIVKKSEEPAPRWV